jgi:hypothetical protein
MVTVFAGTESGIWHVGPAQRIELDGHRVTALAHDAADVWAVVDDHAIQHRGTDGTWRHVAQIDTFQLNCVLPLGGAALAGTSDAHLVRIENGAGVTVVGFDAAPDRHDWYTPWGGPPDVRTIAAGTSGELYANVHVGGILRSQDGGNSWQPTIDIHADVHQVYADPDHPDIVLAATARGLAISGDGGRSWSFDRDGLHDGYCRAVARAGDAVLLTASLGPSGNRGALYRRPLDRDAPFEKCMNGLPEWFPHNIDSGCLAASGATAAFGTDDGRIFISEDGGVTWEEAASGLPPVRSLTLTP